MIARIRRLAPLTLTAGVILILCGLLWTLVHGRLERVGEVTLAAGLIAVVAYVAAEPARVWRVLSGRRAREGSNAAVVTLALIGILFLVNVLAARHHKRFDLTADREFSLSLQTRQVLASLKEPVAVTAFMTPRYFAAQQVEDLLKEYSYQSDKIQLEFVDPEQKPALARQFGITRDGTVVFELGERRQEAIGSDEQAFTSALVKITREEAKVVYFLTGHGERDPREHTASGYERIAQALERDNYQLDVVNLAITPTVPADAAVLVIAAPTIMPTPEELQAISNYVDRAGSLLVLGDPATDVTLDELLARWGLRLRRDIIIDPVSSLFGDVAAPLASRFPHHEITKDLGGLSTFFPAACSIAAKEPPPAGVTISSLVQSSVQSWGETARESRQVRLDPGEDTAGPLNLVVAATQELPEYDAEGRPGRARLVLFGDADFVSNDVLHSVQGNLANADLFLNAVSWLVEEESLISIRPLPSTSRMVLLTPTDVRLVMYTSLLFLPGLVVVVGAWVWWQRR
jgi:ABC-type uncharacterized transport system involved in gliding motility auxiliary subunit